MKAAKQLVGCFPHARPPEPETYAAALGATLAQYPEQVVRDCVDPRIGLARKREFPPTVASIVEWCDTRLAYYQVLAKYEEREQAPPEREFNEDDRLLARNFLSDLAAELESRKPARRPGQPTTLGEHIRKAMERPRQGLTPAREAAE